jgi:galactose mutarotase-like enzyme
MNSGLVIENEFAQVTCYPHHGFTIGSIVDKCLDQELLWRPSGSSFRKLTGGLGPSGPLSNDYFDEQILAGGWFTMFPTSGPVTGDDTRWMHGELARISWDVVNHSPDQITCMATTPDTRFNVTRTVTLRTRKISTSTTAVSTAPHDIPATFGEHPCFRREIFAGGKIDAERGSSAWVGSVGDPRHSQLQPHQTFLWPDALTHDGSATDRSSIPIGADGRHNHVVIAPPNGTVTLTTGTRSGVRISWDTGTFSQALLWEHYKPASSPWDGDVLAVEPISAPSRTWDEAVAQGTTTIIRSGESLTYSCSIELIQR